MTDASMRMSLSYNDATATLTLCRPPMNAIDDLFLHTLDRCLSDLEQSPNVTVLRIRSAQRVFCAGADLAVVGGRAGRIDGAEEMVTTVRKFHRVFDRLAALPCVTIAEIEGHALGGGFELALACDLRIVSHAAKLGLPEAKMGLLPGAGGTQRLTHLCGPGIAARIILTGDMVNGNEAVSLGMAQWAAAPESFAVLADEIAERTAALSKHSLRRAKQCISHAVIPMQAGADAEIIGLGALMMEPDTGQRIAKFLSK